MEFVDLREETACDREDGEENLDHEVGEVAARGDEHLMGRVGPDMDDVAGSDCVAVSVDDSGAADFARRDLPATLNELPMM